jgi:hypothetical protein
MKREEFSNNLLLVLSLILFTSCGPKTIEEQVEQIMQSENAKERNSISCALADSLSTKPAQLFFMKIHSNPVVVESLQNMLTRYSEIIVYQEDKNREVLDCIRYIIEPTPQSPNEINQLKVELIVNALQVESPNIQYENTLITAAKNHGGIAMSKLFDAWYEGKRSSSILNAIKSFDNEAIDQLANRIERDSVAVDLLARFGQASVSTMMEKMKDEDQNIRFAAGDVLVQMQKYDPDAINVLTSAIDEGGTRVIAQNYPFYIRLGQVGTEKILLKALDRYFNEKMCIDYLNCGNSDLESGASGIASKHGYWVTSSFGSHYGPEWGSDY